MTKLVMPSLSPTMEHGSVVQWMKQVGDPVAPHDILAVIQTDKAGVDYESTDAGFLAAQLVPADKNKEWPLGHVIGVLVENKEDVATVQYLIKAGKLPFAQQAAPAAAPKKEVAAAPAAASPAPSAPKPAEQPKVAASFPSPSSSSSSSSGDFSSALKAYTSTGGHLSPAVYSILAGEKIDPASIKGTGKHGRILKGDVLKALESGSVKRLSGGSSAAAPQAAAATATPAATAPPTGRRQRSHEDQPLTQMRKVIASRLTQSKGSIPHHYVSTECRLDALLAARKQAKDATGSAASVNDYVIRAAAVALKLVSEANAKYDPKADSVVELREVDISVAVATPSGLITPIVKNADRKQVDQIAADVRDLATRAKDNKLKPEEFMGGSFTISNLGMFGISEFSAVINPPQACILAVSAGQPRVVPAANGKGFETATYMTVQLSCDQRVVDSEVAARWLRAFQTALEQPSLLSL